MKKLFLILFLFVGINAYSQQVVLMYSDTVSTATDTASRHYSSTCNSFTTFILNNYTFSVTADDTLQFSTSADFSQYFILFPNESYNSPVWSAFFIPNLYFKRYGTVGVPFYRFILTGNK